MGKASTQLVAIRTLNFARKFIGSIETKAHLTKVALGVLRDSQKLSGHP